MGTIMGLLKLLPTIVQIGGWIISRDNAKNAKASEFLKFVEEASQDFKNSADQKSSYDAQRKRMDQIEKEEKENAGKNKQNS